MDCFVSWGSTGVQNPYCVVRNEFQVVSDTKTPQPFGLVRWSGSSSASAEKQLALS